MAHDGLAPPLALSDILHTLSPSPAPQPANQPSTPRPPSPPGSPEPLNQTQIDSMRDRVLEIRGQADNTAGLSSRETELISMVLRLTCARIPEPSQVLEQANTIYQLTQQREFMINEINAERSRWTAERDGFARMTEALISRHSRGKDHESSYRENELERMVATLDVDNRALRHKIAEYHTRIGSLESELSQLRPVLLMQPFALTHNIGTTSKQKSQPKPKRQRYHDAAPTPTSTLTQPSNEALASSEAQIINQGEQHDHATSSQPQPTSASNPSKPDYYRRRDTEVAKHHSTSTSKSKRARQAAKKQPSVFSNARAEHLLLAARKIGKERAAILAGLAPQSSQQRSRKTTKKNEAGTSSVTTNVKTPKRRAAPNPAPPPAPAPSASKDSFERPPKDASLNARPRTPDTAPVAGPSTLPSNPPALTAGSAPIPLTKPSAPPRSHQTRSNAPEPTPTAANTLHASARAARTPLDSLLTAAHSISLAEEAPDSPPPSSPTADETTPTLRRSTRTRHAPGPPLDSPSPTKRRRVAGVGSTSGPSTFSSSRSSLIPMRNTDESDGGGRVRSALDVLADQAEAQRSTTQREKGKASERSKGKGKARENEEDTDYAERPTTSSAAYDSEVLRTLVSTPAPDPSQIQSTLRRSLTPLARPPIPLPHPQTPPPPPSPSPSSSRSVAPPTFTSQDPADFGPHPNPDPDFEVRARSSSIGSSRDGEHELDDEILPEH